jgi:hypothetical protein
VSYGIIYKVTNNKKLSDSHKGYKPSDESNRKRPETLNKLNRRGKNHPCYGKKQSSETIERRVNKIAKTYCFVSPPGEVFVITNLSKFCRDQGNLCSTNMTKVWLEKRKSHKGWTKYKEVGGGKS